MKKIIIAFVSILLFSCSEKKSVSIPDDIFPEEKMAAVMVDMHLLEASMNLNTINTNTPTAQAPSPTFDVLKKHTITKKQYDDSFTFYTMNPVLLGEVYQLVLNDLSKMQAEVMNKK